MTFSTDEFARALAQHDYAFQTGQTVRGKVFQHTSDGAYVDVGGKSAAFLPLAEASLKTVTNLAEFLPLQEERDFLVIRDQDENGQVTLSLRRLEIKLLWEQLAEMQENQQTLQVRVTGVNKGGVTVNVRGLRGFIPRSHLPVGEDLEALKGQTLAASFLEVDPERNKLVLSNRLAHRSTRMAELEIGQLVTGKITGIKPFGAFVDLEGTTALLHVREISQNFVASLPDLFQVGEVIQAVVIDIDQGKGRISLSTKVLENRAGEMLEDRQKVMAEAEDRANRYRTKLQQEG